MIRTAHELLLESSAGYRRWYENEVKDWQDIFGDWDTDPDPQYLQRAFADWLVSPAGDLESFIDWTEDQFNDEWDRWNS